MLGKRFEGVWASFAYIDDTCGAIHRLRQEGREYSVLSPCPRYELEEAQGNPGSIIPFVTLVFGALGIFMGYAMTSWMSLDWVLPVSRKPIVSIPPYTIFGFELMVLLGGLATAVSIFLLGGLALLRKPLPRSTDWRAYDRFSEDRFGVVVRCPAAEAEAVAKTLQDYHPELVVHEFANEHPTSSNS